MAQVNVLVFEQNIEEETFNILAVGILDSKSYDPSYSKLTTY